MPKRKRGDSHQFSVDGQEYAGEYLGKGAFAEAFRVEGDVFCFVKEDWTKEAISDIDQPHLPRIERVDVQEDRDGENIYVYKMPFYEPLTAKCRTAWMEYRELERALAEARAAFSHRPGGVYNGYEIMCRTIERANVSDELRAALETLRDSAMNYGSSITFEFAPRNLGVDESGRLVLRDVLFDQEIMEKRNREYVARRQAREQMRPPYYRR